MYKNIIILVIFLVGASLVSNRPLEAAGLSTTFSEVTLENLETGKSYSTRDVAGLPLVVINTGEEEVDLKIEVLLPQAGELKEGFEPIPDLSWIRLEKEEFKGIKPGEQAVSDVVISIPDDTRYEGKRYQVFIWSHTIGKRIGVGLKSKLLLSILNTKEETKQ